MDIFIDYQKNKDLEEVPNLKNSQKLLDIFNFHFPFYSKNKNKHYEIIKALCVNKHLPVECQIEIAKTNDTFLKWDLAIMENLNDDVFDVLMNSSNAIKQLLVDNPTTSFANLRKLANDEDPVISMSALNKIKSKS